MTVYKKYKNETEIFRLWEWLISIIVALMVLFIISQCELHLVKQVLLRLGDWLLNAAIMILSITIASFAVFAAMLDNEFSVFLVETDTYIGLSFPFWVATIIWSIIIGINGFFLLIVSALQLPHGIEIILSFPVIIFFCLGICFTLSMVGSIFTIGHYRAKFYKAKNEQEKH